MNKILKKISFPLFFFIISCQVQELRQEISLQESEQHLTNFIIQDIYSPPVAARYYAYSNLAWYEAIRWQDSNAVSIIEKMQAFDQIPAPHKGVVYKLAAIRSFFTTAKTLLLASKDSLASLQKDLEKNAATAYPKESVAASFQYGDFVAAVIIKRAEKDNFKATRGLAKYSTFLETGKWQQTPPDYADALEPYWGTILPLAIESADLYRAYPPPSYSKDVSSLYQQQVKEVWNISRQLTPEQDTIAHYWDDNAFVSQHQGHFTFATKKTTPGGHWMGIAAILTNQQKASEVTTSFCFALTSAAILDGFIACWYDKYKTQMPRPITVIREQYDPNWNALLQTPPFPEYTSGHSVISAAASEILFEIFGNVPFQDTTELPYLGLQRHFLSVKHAADEAGISRLYGGIHFRAAIENGKEQGKKIANRYKQLYFIK